jgi:hypothetical protein
VIYSYEEWEDRFEEEENWADSELSEERLAIAAEFQRFTTPELKRLLRNISNVWDKYWPRYNRTWKSMPVEVQHILRDAIRLRRLIPAELSRRRLVKERFDFIVRAHGLAAAIEYFIEAGFYEQWLPRPQSLLGPLHPVTDF